MNRSIWYALYDVHVFKEGKVLVQYRRDQLLPMYQEYFADEQWLDTPRPFHYNGDLPGGVFDGASMTSYQAVYDWCAMDEVNES